MLTLIRLVVEQSQHKATKIALLLNMTKTEIINGRSDLVTQEQIHRKERGTLQQIQTEIPM